MSPAARTGAAGSPPGSSSDPKSFRGGEVQSPTSSSVPAAEQQLGAKALMVKCFWRAWVSHPHHQPRAHFTGQAGLTAPSPASVVSSLQRPVLLGPRWSTLGSPQAPPNLDLLLLGRGLPFLAKGVTVSADLGKLASLSSAPAGPPPSNSPSEPACCSAPALTLALLLFPSRKGPASPTRPAVPRPAEAPLLDL